MTPSVEFRRIPGATALAALVATVGNGLVWSVGAAVDRMTIGVGEVVLASLVGAVAGGLTFALCGRFAGKPVKVFTGLCIAVVVIYAGGPFLAAWEPYMEGAKRFNAATIVATQGMHLVSAGSVWYFLTRRAVSSPGSLADSS